MASRLQSYMIILKVDSVAYGKNVNERKLQPSTNQHFINIHMLPPMENFLWRHGKKDM